MKNIVLAFWVVMCAASLGAQTMRVHTGNGLQEFNLSDIDSITFGQTAATAYVAEFAAQNEDYVDFGPVPGFTHNTSWTVIEKVQLPPAATPGWHMFRGSAWQDKEGDIAISADSTHVQAWLYLTGWVYLTIGNIPRPVDNRYVICLQYDLAAQEARLFVNDTSLTIPAILPANDSANTNPLYFGGQHVDSSYHEGDLYSETDIIIEHHAWLQRCLTPTEIANYNGTINLADPKLFFATSISATGMTDVSPAGRTASIGNTPVFRLKE